jgi:uncharacterized protein (DUF1800 family)
MQITRRDFLKDIAFAAALVGLPPWVDQLDEPPPMEMMNLASSTYPWPWRAAGELGTASPALTVINRVSFGPRPGDFERVQQMGIDAYIDEQLHPESIDDRAVEQRVAELYPTLAMSAGELMQNYPQPKQAAAAPASQVQRLETLLAGLGLQPPAQTPAQVAAELQEATMLRAIFSRRQLQQVLVDFWSDHFNIYVYKNADRWLKTVDDREVIRKYAFAKFKDLLQASAESPAMIEYLDNRENVKGNANENYAREVMELHTLGVDGGYTQNDVEELARAFTGWTIRTPKRAGLFGEIDYTDAGTFFFNPKQHDDGAKRVLGIDLPPGGGINDALRIIDVLAHHPSTAQFISTKLVRRFVSDTPPAALVQRAAQTFTQSDGDIRAVMSTILHSDEFRNSFAQKIKRPFDLIVSTLRAVDAQLDDTRAPALALRLMGQGLFQHLTPDGYPDYGSAWINTNGLLGRWNFALIVAANRVPGGNIDLQAALSKVTSVNGAVPRTVGEMVDFWVNYLLHRTIPDADRQKLINAVGGSADAAFNAARLPELVALILASPHFQYR